MRFLLTQLAILALLVTSQTGQAHTVVMHTENMAMMRPEGIRMPLVFTHATDGGPTMPLEIESFVLASGREFFVQDTDLMDTLEPVQWLNKINEDGSEHRVDAFIANIPRETIRSLGDHQFLLTTKPYFDENDQIYIQQFVKMILNVGGAQTNWYTTQGMPAEIHILKKPYANWVGETISGVVLSDGQPVPYARLEIDYLNYEPDMDNLRFDSEPRIQPGHPSYKYISIMTNADGEFHFGIPYAGWWALAALGVGPEGIKDGYYFSQDAILWIYAEDVPAGAASL